MREYVLKNQKKLRRGYTTGTCSAAASAAAAEYLLSGNVSDTVTILTPGGETVAIPVKREDSASGNVVFSVVKFSGDDPDVTNGTLICAELSYLDDQAPETTWFTSEEHPNLYLDGGIGVGRVTKEGLEQSVGSAAINKVPRRMIFAAVGAVCEQTDCERPILIRISVPEGAELALRTFNPMLGIEGGISILGTSGIVEPMSEKAILDTIELQVNMRKKAGDRTILMIPGNYGRKYAEANLGLDTEYAVETSNFIGETIDLAVSVGFEKMLMIGNFGKLVKLAAGIMNTHSKMADGRAEIVGVHAAIAGADAAGVQKIMECITTDQMIGYLDEWGIREKVLGAIIEKITHHIGRRIHGQMDFGIILFSEKYGYLGETEGASALLEVLRAEQQN